MLSTAYRLLTDIGAPIISFYLRRRRKRGREDAERFYERLGFPSMPRPKSRIIWCHAASVGEAASLLALIDKLRATYSDTHVLITTGTVTSARMLAGRLPHGVTHQYMPVDRMKYVRRFLAHWRPDFIIWVESELWPNILSEIRIQKIPAILINGSMSEKSFRNWYRFRLWASEILGAFLLCLTQTEEDCSRFVALGAKPVRCIGNIKYAGNPLPCEADELTRLRHIIGTRPVWLMASTHRGEEDLALDAHVTLKETWPDLLTVIVPRHPARGQEIADRIITRGIVFSQRSRGEVPDARAEIYLADTLGELGLFYRLCPIMGMGGSFVPVGGHNIIEAAQLGCAIFFGPHMHDFAEIKREFVDHHAALALRHANEIVFTVDRLLRAPEARIQLAHAARELADAKRHILDKVMDAVKPWLDEDADIKEKKIWGAQS